MALETFTAGEFARYSDVAEWDGENHEEIAEWLNGLDGTTEFALGWRVTEVTPRSVTFFKSAHPDDRTWPDREVVIHRGQWICAVESATVGSSLRLVAALDPAGKWKTSDPYGRPGNLDDLVSTDG
jgi:hypothetical protein